MPGALLNLITSGVENVLLNGNPTKSFFKVTYAKYTNFGMQRFRLDYTGATTLHLNESSKYSFTIPRYGDLLMDTYFAINLPDIYSTSGYLPRKYKFQWIEYIGTEIIEEVEVQAGGQTLQKISGTAINLMAHRDVSSKKLLYDEMIGHRLELYNPEFAQGNNGYYPHADYHHEEEGVANPEPSIKGTTLYVPLPFWFCQASSQAFPLIALQYTELKIVLKLRPIKDLFTICDLSGNRLKPNFNDASEGFHRFTQVPPENENLYQTYSTNMIDFGIHLISNYIFLTQEENNALVAKPLTYLMKDTYETTFHDLVGFNKIRTNSNSLVTSWIWAFRRSDATNRNAWSNFTNWEYKTKDLVELISEDYGRRPVVDDKYIREIMKSASIVIDGKERENTFASGIYKYIAPYNQSYGSAITYLPYMYFYNFCLDTMPNKVQPSGAFNFSQFSKTELEVTLHTPTKVSDPTIQNVQCDPVTGAIISFTKNVSSLYEYTYDMLFVEERYNQLIVTNGLCSLKFAR
tara:strand:- start:4398 stop:5954 length:1557 start_codon:yes stop_codon:yes gene_type:complete